MGTLNNSEKAATFVALSLLAGIATGIWSFFDFVKTNAVRLLIACVLITLFLIVASVYIVVKLHRATQALEKYGVPPDRTHQAAQSPAVADAHDRPRGNCRRHRFPHRGRHHDASGRVRGGHRSDRHARADNHLLDHPGADADTHTDNVTV